MGTLADMIENYQRALTVEEFAELVRISEKTVRRQIRAGKIPAYRIGTLVRLDPAQTAEWMRERLRACGSTW